MSEPSVLSREDLALIQDPAFYRTAKPLVARLAVAVLEHRRQNESATAGLSVEALIEALRKRGLVVELHVFDMGPPIGIERHG